MDKKAKRVQGMEGNLTTTQYELYVEMLSEVTNNPQDSYSQSESWLIVTGATTEQKLKVLSKILG